MIAGNNGITGLPGSVKVTLILSLAWFHVCIINHLFSDILKQHSSIPPATQDRRHFHWPHGCCKCWAMLLYEKRHGCSLTLFSHGNLVLKPPPSARTSWYVQLVGQTAHTTKHTLVSSQEAEMGWVCYIVAGLPAGPGWIQRRNFHNPCLCFSARSLWIARCNEQLTLRIDCDTPHSYKFAHHFFKKLLNISFGIWLIVRK